MYTLYSYHVTAILTLSWSAIMPTNLQDYFSNNQPYILVGSPLYFPGSFSFTFSASNIFLVAVAAVVTVVAIVAVVDAAVVAWLSASAFATFASNYLQISYYHVF